MESVMRDIVSKRGARIPDIPIRYLALGHVLYILGSRSF